MHPLIVLIIGMTVVFAGLMVLAFIITLIGKACVALQDKQKTQKKADILPSSHTKPHVQRHAVALSPQKRAELMAVISASIAMQTGTTASQLQIRSIRRIADRGFSEANWSNRGELIAAISAAIASSSSIKGGIRIVSCRKI